MKDLRPAVREYERLEAACVALDGVLEPAPARQRTARKPTAPGRRARGRPAGNGKRGPQALSLVKAHPGIEISEIAKRLGMAQNYLYRVLPKLAEQGLVEKRGRGWHPTATAA